MVEQVAYSPPLSVLAGTLLLGVAYALCVGVYRGRFGGSERVSRWRMVSFGGGLAAILVALASPLDTLADEYLFTAHMVQHLLLTLVVAPLLLAGLPGWLFADLLRTTRLTRLARFARQPLVAFFTFNLIFSLSHVPAVYEAALRSEPLHIFEHLLFIAAALVMWLPVVSPAPEIVPRYPPLAQVLYLFLQTVPSSLVGALLASTGTAYYATYVQAPRLEWLRLSPSDDQQLGGLIMWVGSGVYFLIASAVVFFAWASREEAANRRPVGAYQRGG